MKTECPSEKESCAFADASAEKAVKKTFAILGVDIDKPEEVKQFQQDLRFGSFLRKAAERGMLALIVATFTAVGAVIWVGVKHALLEGR